MTVIVKSPGDSMSYRVYVDSINADLVSASFVVNGLTFGTCTVDNATTPRSVIVPVSGGTHGQAYQGVGTFTLASGGPLERPITIRLFAS